MAITKEIEIAKIEVVGVYKHVQVATDTVIKEDGTELSRSRHRHVLDCGTLNDSDALIDRDILQLTILFILTMYQVQIAPHHLIRLMVLVR